MGLSLSMKFFLYYVGKPRDESANHLADEYIKRCTRYAKVEMREIRPARFDPWTAHPSAAKILLDPAGISIDSAAFAKRIGKAQQEARDQVFLIGGAEGPPPGWHDRADVLLSLSPMTLPHELARVMLAEQLYRAFTILRGHPYPR